MIVNGDINKVHGKFERNHLQLLACGATVDDPIGLLFDAYRVVPCHNFKEYIRRHHDDWLDGKLTGITHETLMTFATHKCDNLKNKGTWGAKSPGNEKIVAMLAALNALKGHPKPDDKLGDVIKGKGKGKRKGKGSDKKTKNKKNTGKKAQQKEDEAWKKVPPKDGDKKSKEVASTLTIGVNIMWHGACTSHLNVAWAKNGRRNSKKRSQPTLQTLPCMPPLLL